MKEKNMVWLVALFIIFIGFLVLTTSRTSYQIIGEDVVGVNVPYMASISLTAPEPPDSDYSDGTITKYRGATKILDESKNYVFENPEIDMASEFFVDELIWTPTTAGKYVIMAVIAKQTNVYDFDTMTWLGWSGEIEVVREEKVITVEGVSPPPDPIWDLKAWVLGIINTITSFLCSTWGIFC
ncbi:MAG: hypothetical protein KKB31_00765 [Nanoarchaeota archaeon]|nr:hypothetical protein [Nanoarchaeota archaeon]